MSNTLTAEEVCRRYQIPAEVLEEYKSMGLCGAVRLAMDDWQYDDADLERLRLILALHDIGFDQPDIESYMRLVLKKDKSKNERLRFLDERRKEKLNEIHRHEHQLERIDYLRYKLRSE